MPLTQHDVTVHAVGEFQVVDLQVDGPASYTTGGEPLPVIPEAYGLGTIRRVEIEPTAANQFYIWDYTNKKIIFTDGAGTQAANASDQSARTNIRVRLWFSRR